MQLKGLNKAEFRGSEVTLKFGLVIAKTVMSCTSLFLSQLRHVSVTVFSCHIVLFVRNCHIWGQNLAR